VVFVFFDLFVLESISNFLKTYKQKLERKNFTVTDINDNNDTYSPINRKKFTVDELRTIQSAVVPQLLRRHGIRNHNCHKKQ